jgi:hypothetical protein
MRLRGYREAAMRSAEKAALTQAWAACTIPPSSAGELSVALGAMRAALGSPSC